MKQLISLLSYFLLLTSFIAAQEVGEESNGQDAVKAVMNLIEEWAELNDSETTPDEIIEDLETFMDNPINLNDTISEMLAQLPFITDLQRDIIKAYIAQNGPMVTKAELYFLNGFDSLQIKLLSLFTTVAPIEEDKFPTLNEILTNGKSNLRLGVKTVLPKSRGYDEGKYLGSPFREYFRYNFHYSNHISFQLSGDKDAGEPFLFSKADGNNKTPSFGFDYYGYHLMISDIGIIKKAIIGKYQLQFGQGATLWSGFAPWCSLDAPLRRFGQGIRPASALCEYGYLRGVAVTMELIPKHLETTVFYSFVNRGATTDTSENDIEIITSIYNSGYHRTINEISKKNRLDEHLAGAHIHYRHNSFSIGATAFGTFFANQIQPTDNVYNTFVFRGQRLFNAGIDASWRYRRTIFFGEVATSAEPDNNVTLNDNSVSTTFPVAAIAGLQTYFNSDNALSVAFRYGSVNYHNFYANTIGQSSSPQNESGVIIHFRTRMPLNIQLSSSADIFRHPWMRYRLYAPSTGADYRIRLTKNILPNTQLVAQYQYKAVDRNSDLHSYAVETTTRQRFSLHLDYNSDGWHLLSRVILTRFDCIDHKPEHGLLLHQDVGRTFKLFGNDMTVNVRAAIFDVSAYDARLYISESDMLYEFGATMLMNRGMRNYLVIRYDLSHDLALALKYAISYYPEQESQGSGYDITLGSVRHEMKAQLRLRF